MISSKLRWLPIPVAFLLLVATGLAYGLRNDRWSTSVEVAQMTARLPQIPMKIGDWVGQSDDNPKLTERLKKRGTVAEMVSRVYQNTRTGQTITLLVATGRPGPISTHTPQTCVGDSTGWDRASKEKRVTINADVPPPPGASSESNPQPLFATCKFARKNTAIPEAITIYWSWHSKKDGWTAVDDARVAFGTYMALTKIYVVEDSTADFASSGSDAATRFIEDCLPTINATLFGPEPTTPATAATEAAETAA